MRPISPSGMADEGRASFSMAPSDTVNALILADGQPEVSPIPPGAAHVAFSATIDVYVRFGGESVMVAVPAENELDGQAPELNPSMRFIPQDATHIAVVGSGAGVVTLSFYGS